MSKVEGRKVGKPGGRAVFLTTTERGSECVGREAGIEVGRWLTEGQDCFLTQGRRGAKDAKVWEGGTERGSECVGREAGGGRAEGSALERSGRAMTKRGSA